MAGLRNSKENIEKLLKVIAPDLHKVEMRELSTSDNRVFNEFYWIHRSLHTYSGKEYGLQLEPIQLLLPVRSDQPESYRGISVKDGLNIMTIGVDRRTIRKSNPHKGSVLIGFSGFIGREDTSLQYRIVKEGQRYELFLAAPKISRYGWIDVKDFFPTTYKNHIAFSELLSDAVRTERFKQYGGRAQTGG